MKKFLVGFIVILAAIAIAICTLDIGTGFIVNKAAEYIAQNYGFDMTMAEAKGNPVKGYNFSGIELKKGEAILLKAEKVTVDLDLKQIITGNAALKWIEISKVATNVPHILELSESITGSKLSFPETLNLDKVVINKIEGTVSTEALKGTVDMVLNNLPATCNLEISFRDNSISIPEMTLSLLGGNINISGQILPDTSLKVTAKNLSVSDLGTVFSHVTDLALRGSVNADATVSIPASVPLIEGTLSFDDGAACGLPISVSTLFGFKDMKLSLSPLTAQIMGIPAQGAIYADLSTEIPTIKADIKSEDSVDVDTLRKNIQGLPEDLKGQIDTFSLSLSGPVSSLSGSVELNADKFSIGSQTITETLFRADLSQSSQVSFNGSSDIAGNKAELKGSANIGEEDFYADIALSAKDFDLAVLPKLIASAPENIKGKVTADLTVKGEKNNITAAGKITSTRISLNDMNVDKLNVPFSFSNGVVIFENATFSFMDLPVTNVNGSITMAGDNIAFKEMSANVAGGQIKLDSTLLFSKNLNGTYDLSISSIDLGSVMKTFKAENLGVKGKFAGNINGTISDTDITGDGAISIPSFSIMGLASTNIKSSVKLSKMILSLPNVSSNLAEGTIDGNVSLDINKMSYLINANLNGSQLKSIISQMAPTLGGGLTGKLTGTYSANGKLNPFSLSGTGSVASSGGELYGFDKYKSYIDLAAQLHGSKEIEYANANILFDTDLSKLTLKDGTIINAKSGDGIYEYIKANGTVAYSGALNIGVEGSINAMLVNTAASALSGAITAGGTSSLLTGNSLTGILSGIATGASSAYGKADFHTLSFKVSGTVEKPKFSDFKEDGKTWTVQEVSGGTTNSSSNAVDTVNTIKNTLSGKASSSSTKSTGSKSSSNTKKTSSSKSSSSKSDTLKQIGGSLGNLLKK